MARDLLQWTVFRDLKLCFLLIMTCLSIKAQAIINPINRRISFSVVNSPIKKALDKIQDQSGLKFTYSNELFDETKEISLSVVNEPLKVVLDKLLLQTDCVWALRDEFIVLRKGKIHFVDGLDLISDNDTIINISGTIIDEKGQPIPGVTVAVRGTGIGTLTNNKGRFSLKGVPKKSYVTLTSIGFTSQQISTETEPNKWETIVMKIAVNDLDAAVIQAYTISSKRYGTSSISTITSADIEKKPVTNLLLALQGEVPGISVTQMTGIANGGIKVRIRGQNSIDKGSDPLYVIDGVPYTSQLMETVNYSLGLSGDANRTEFSKAGNPLSFINPADIESISILKDADATSIYGSRAAAGAIIITTKKGKSGPTKFNVNIQQGWGKIPKFMKMLNRDQYLEMRHEAKANGNDGIYDNDYDLNGQWDTTRNTDWQKALLGRTANYSDYQVSASGGSDNTTYLIGGGYHRESSVFLNDVVNNKGSLHVNISNTSLNQKFRLQFSGAFMADRNILPASDLAAYALRLPPVAPKLYNNDGTLNWQLTSSGVQTWQNPIASSALTGSTKTNNLISNLMLSYNIAKGLSINTNLGYTNTQINEVTTYPSSTFAPRYRPYNLQYADYSNGGIKSWIIEPQLKYSVNIGEGRLQALLGSTLQYNNNSQQLFEGTGYVSDQLLGDIKSATGLQVLSTTATTYRYNALFGLINYRFKSGKYNINFSARRDGSSRFGADNLFHNFASIGGAWIFSDERFFVNRIRFINLGKLQASYGTTGNDQIGSYKYLNLYYSNTPVIPYQGISGLTVYGVPNPNLQWEVTKKFNLSIDLEAFNSRIAFNTTYFRNRSSNQLLNYQLPLFTGSGGYTRNFPATIQNDGWEFSLNTVNISRKYFKWSTRANYYMPNNKLVSFPNIEKSSYAQTYEVGKPITNARVYRFGGVNPQTGLYQFFNYKGELTSSPDYKADQIYINTSAPFLGGISNSFNYKGFQLDVLIQYNKQYVKTVKYGLDYPGFAVNEPTTILNRWRKSGDHAEVQIYSTGFDSVYTAYTNMLSSNASYINCTLIRIKNVSFSWNCPENWCNRAKVKNAQLYIHAQNLFSFSNYVGPDPETALSGSLPPLRVITLGIQASF